MGGGSSSGSDSNSDGSGSGQDNRAPADDDEGAGAQSTVDDYAHEAGVQQAAGGGGSGFAVEHEQLTDDPVPTDQADDIATFAQNTFAEGTIAERFREESPRTEHEQRRPWKIGPIASGDGVSLTPVISSGEIGSTIPAKTPASPPM